MTIDTVTQTATALGGPLRVAEYLRGREFPDTGFLVNILGFADAMAAPRLTNWSAEDAAVRVTVHLAGRLALIGPATRKGALGGPCHRCLARRWQTLRPNEERHVLEVLGSQIRSVGPNPYLTDYALDAIRDLCAALSSQATTVGDGVGAVYELAMDTLAVRQFPLIADPTCPACGIPRIDTAEAAVLTLTSRPKSAVDDFRLCSALDYDIDVDAYANPICGALGFGAFPAYESPTTAPVTGAMRMHGRFGYHEFFWSGHADRFDVSRRLAILEGIERHAGLQAFGLAEQTVDSYANLREHALDPRECGVYSDEYYRHTPFHQPFREDVALPWVWAYSFREQRPILVPEQLVYYGSGVLGGQETFVMECSNGCATGSCLEEALLFGMLELIERDAFLCAWYGKVPLPEIDPASCASTQTKIMIELMALYGYDVRLFDNRIDLPVPVVTAVAVRRDGGLGTLCFAAGASLDPEDAVRAALCEVASYVPEFDRRTTADLADAQAMAADFDRVLELRHHSLLYGLPEMAHHADFLLARSDAPGPMTEVYESWKAQRVRSLDLLDDVTFVRDTLLSHGFDVIVADQTSRQQHREGLRTTCVIVPGLLPIDFGWRRQRALHMPRTRTAAWRAGLLDHELNPGELNLAPHPFP
jgi:ribosomal protein S12 methylthiotransferase accessory factor